MYLTAHIKRLSWCLRSSQIVRLALTVCLQTKPRDSDDPYGHKRSECRVGSLLFAWTSFPPRSGWIADAIWYRR